MKKRKKYEVSVINKTYSKTYSDETKFYTSDTALELNFQLKEVEYDFDSAEIILLNVDDRSLATRPVSKNTEGFTYELENDIVEHYGEWKGQLKFNEGGEIYVSSPVIFRIENDLNNDRPPKLNEVNTWKNLREIADKLIIDLQIEQDETLGFLENRQDTVESKFDLLQQEMTDKDPISAPEIIAARGGEPTLSARLDKEKQEFATQLAQKADKGNVSVHDINKNLGRFDQTYMTEEFMQQIAGTTPINAIPAQESITTDMIADTIKSINLFNSALQLGALTATGVPTVNENLIVTTNFIYVEENTTYTIRNSNNYPVRIAFYNSQDNFISYIQFENTFTTPANTRKLKLSTFQANGHNDLNTLFMLNEGSTALPYEPYVSPKIKQKYIEPISEIPDDSVGTESLQDGAVTITKTDFFEQGKNIFDKSKVIEGYYVNQVSGVLQANPAHKASSPMPVESGSTYVSAQFLQRYAVYNGETFVSGGLNTFTVTIPSGANRLVVSSDGFDIDTLQIEKGTVATPYESYGYKVKDELLPPVYGDSGNQFIGDGAKKYRIVGANIRTPLAAGLPFTLLDDAGHEPMGITSATIVGDGLRIGMPFTADKVISMSATPHVSMRNEGWDVATTGGLSVHEVHFYKNGVHVPASEVVQNGGSFWYSGVFLV